MRGFVLVLTTLVAFGTAGAAQTTVDSLKQLLRGARTDTARLRLLLELTNEMLLTQNVETLEYLRRAETIARKVSAPVQTCRLWLRYGRYYSFVGDYEKAAQYYLRAMEEAERAGDDQTVEYAMNNFAVLNMQIKNYQKGIETFERLVDRARRRGDRKAEVEYLLNLATAYGEKGDLVQSEANLRKVYTSPGVELFYKTVAANNLSFVCNLGHRYREAERYAREAIRAWPTLHNVQLYLQSLTNLSNALIGQRQFAEARPVTEKLIQLAKENNFEREFVDALGSLAAIHEGLGDYRTALRYQKEYATQKDSLLIRDNLQQINELQIKYETARKEREIALRTAQLKTARLRLRFVGVVFAMTLVFSVILANLYVKKARAYEELVRKNLELMNSETLIDSLERKIEENDSNGDGHGSPADAHAADERKTELLRRLRKAFQEDKIHLRSDLTLEKLATELGVSSRYLSQVIHAHYGTSFPHLLHRLRVSEARRMLADERYRHYSIEGVARSVGFSSKSTFNLAFKRITGLTPSYFRESVFRVTQPSSS